MKNFIKARLNRDNFWNLMLWFGMSLGWCLTFSIDELYPTISLITFWITLLGVPYAVKKANKLSFDIENGFFNKEGRLLKTSYPKNILDIIILTFLLFPLECFIFEGMAGTLSLFFLTPILYFILKNCPITILFNKNAWCEEVTGVRPMTPEEAARFNSISFRRSNDSYERRHSSSHSFNFNNVYYRK
jgi:hypothetical protein